MIKTVTLRSDNLNSIKNEILFEIASGRVDSSELLRFELKKGENEASFYRLTSGIKRFLKSVKEKGLILLSAYAESFEAGDTSASFLLNKYPEEMSSAPKTSEAGEFFFYVKI